MPRTSERSASRSFLNGAYHIVFKGLVAGVIAGSAHLFILTYLSKIHPLTKFASK